MDREVDYAKGSDMCTVTLVRTERTCVPNTILQELCRSALEAAEMADGGQPWPYVPRQQQQQQSHSRQQEESDSNVARRSVERAHSDEGVLEVSRLRLGLFLRDWLSLREMWTSIAVM